VCLPLTKPGQNRREQGAASLPVLGVALVVGLLAIALGAVGQYVAARFQAATAADAAALAAAPVTFLPFGATGSAAEEAARFAAANGGVLVRCECPPDPSFEPRTVEVEVERRVEVLWFGSVTVRAVSRAEFAPAALFEVADP
jgi:secretion/DNA translocation related TadE-like protein